MIRNPFKKGTMLHIDQFDQETIVDNPSNEPSRNHQFQDMLKVNQLTQNSWNFSPYTRENNYNKMTILNPRNQIVPRAARYKKQIELRKYRQPR